MQVELQDQGLLVPWTDSTPSTYGEVPVDDSAPDLLESSSPSQLLDRHHHHHQHHQPQQHLSPHQQRLPARDQYLLTSSLLYVAPSSDLYQAVPSADTHGSFEYANHVEPDVISHSESEMRTGPGGVGRVDGAGAGKKERKRKREDKSEDMVSMTKMDASQRCDVCGEQGSGHYFGALVCLPCKSFFIRCTKDGRPNFSSQCGGRCDILKGGRVRCQHCRFEKCIRAGMYRKEKPEAVEPAEGQLLCKVCGDIANGVHFGVTTCEGCKKFFRRGLKENRTYACKGNQHCSINPRMRNNCRYCRYQKCLMEGMSREAIKMGRPKKGELSYRKPFKTTRLKPAMMRGSYDKQTTESNQSSMSSEYDQDISASDDAFDPMSVAHQHQIHVSSQLVSGQLQQQQPGTFSLGSLLHDCMTVQDWDQKIELTELDHQAADRAPSHSNSGDNGIGDVKMVPHLRHAGQGVLSETFSTQLQQHQQHQLQSHNQQHQQLMKVMAPLETGVQQRHEIVTYQVHNSVSVVDIGYPSDHDLPVNRPIKVETVLHQNPQDGVYAENVVLEDMRNLETDSKSDFQSYQLQNLDQVTAYSINGQEAPATAVSSSATVVSISHLNPIASSQIVAISMPPQGILYSSQDQKNPAIANALGQHHPNNNPGHNMGLDRQQDAQDKSKHRDGSLQQKIDMSDILTLSRSHHLITNQGVIQTAQNPHISANSHEQNISVVAQNMRNQLNSNVSQQFSPQMTNVSSVEGSFSYPVEALNARKLHGAENETNFAITSFSGQPTITSLQAVSPTSAHVINTSLQTVSPTLANVINVQHKSSGIKNPLAAILHQHRNAIQAGRPIQLTSEEIEELLISVSSDQQQQQQQQQQQAQRLQVLSKGQRGGTSEQAVVDLRRQALDGFSVEPEQQHQQHQIHEFGGYNRETSPNSAESYHSSSNSPPNTYQRSSPANQSISFASRKHFQNQISPVPESSDGASRQDLDGSYNNYNNNNNNNNNSQDNHYISAQHIQASMDNQNDHQGEVYEDSFNSSLIRDSTLLHEINRIFLGIDNSCDTYGCGHHSSDDGTSRVDDRVIASYMSADEFQPEISHRYWHGFQPMEQFMTPEKQKIIQEVVDAFDSLQKTYLTNEPEYINRKMSYDQFEHWHHIQRRIARHVVAGQRFCRNIPGYFRLDIQDRISLGKHVGFGLMVLIACTEFYDPEFKRFKHIWNWTMPMQNPLFSYKVHLLSLGDRIHEIQVDRTEASMMCAISMTSIDCPGLLKPEIVCDVRDALLDALIAHISTKSDSSQRLQNLLSIMPQVRLMTVWYNNLMKKMSLPSEVINNKISKARLREALGTENTPNVS